MGLMAMFIKQTHIHRALYKWFQFNPTMKCTTKCERLFCKINNHNKLSFLLKKKHISTREFINTKSEE